MDQREPAWTLDVTATPRGADLVFIPAGAALGGVGCGVRIGLDRAEARAFARAILAAAGDATERTFPHPRMPEVRRG